jgi:hypothetical protein
MREIAALLHVSKSSVSRWVHDVDLSPEQVDALRQRNPIYDSQRRGNAVWSARRRAERERCQLEGRATARRGESLHTAGCMLYWAEGSKGPHCVEFTNSDPEMAWVFLMFLRVHFNVGDRKVRVWCNLFADHMVRQREIEGFWLRARPSIYLANVSGSRPLTGTRVTASASGAPSGSAS